ncbi:hypothetical protein SRHO_G00228390 [Serrasalmus rhombeus]
MKLSHKVKALKSKAHSVVFRAVEVDAKVNSRAAFTSCAALTATLALLAALFHFWEDWSCDQISMKR